MVDDLKDSRYISIRNWIKTKIESLIRSFHLWPNQRYLIPNHWQTRYAYQRKYKFVYPKDDDAVYSRYSEITGKRIIIFNQLFKNPQRFRNAFRKMYIRMLNTLYVSAKWTNEEAWNTYRTIPNLSIPQRFFLYNHHCMLQGFNRTRRWIRFPMQISLKINAHSEESWLWKGGAMILRTKRKKLHRVSKSTIDKTPIIRMPLCMEFLKNNKDCWRWTMVNNQRKHTRIVVIAAQLLIVLCVFLHVQPDYLSS